VPVSSLSEIEQRLAARVVRLFLHELCHAWEDAFDLASDLLRVEPNPRLLRVLPSDEAVVLVGFELTIGGQRGLLRLCLSGRILDWLGEKLSAGRPAAVAAPAPEPLVEVAVALAESEIAEEELADLRVGDVIATETAVDSPAIVSIAGPARFRGRLGVYQGRKAVRLMEAIEGDEPAS